MKIPSTSPSSQAQVYARFRAAMEEAALARARREAETAVTESHIGSQISLRLSRLTEEAQHVSGLVVHETRETPVSPGSMAVLDTASGKLVYQAPPPLGLV